MLYGRLTLFQRLGATSSSEHLSQRLVALRPWSRGPGRSAGFEKKSPRVADRSFCNSLPQCVDFYHDGLFRLRINLGLASAPGTTHTMSLPQGDGLPGSDPG
jgi:hypothetical protein